jgi:hypothetical protein
VEVRGILLVREDGSNRGRYDVVLGTWTETDVILNFWAKTAQGKGDFEY